MEIRTPRRRRLAWAALAVAMGLILAPTRPPTLAQPPQAPPGNPAAVKAAWRAEVIRLGTELELLQLDQDADRAGILDLMKQARDMALGDEEAPTATQKEIDEVRKAVDEQAKKATPDATNGLAGGLVGMALMMSEQRTRATAGIARKKAAFAQRAAVIVGKRLDLADAERNYRNLP